MNDDKNIPDAVKEKIYALAKELTKKDEDAPETKKLFDSLSLVVAGVLISQKNINVAEA